MTKLAAAVSSQVFLGIDIGSSSCKGVAIEPSGVHLAWASREYPTARPKPGWVEQDSADWTTAAIAVISRLTEVLGSRSSRIAGLAFDGPAHVVALLDKHDRPLRPAIHWADLRSRDIAGRLWRNHRDLIVTTSLQRPDPSWTLSQLIWIAENEPELWRKVARVLPAKDAVRRHFTGDYFTDPYDATGTQLFDPRARRWSPELTALAGVATDMLPSVQTAVTPAGVVSPTVAAATGLPTGTPLAVGSGDSMVEALAIGLVAPGDGVVKLGTAANVSVVVPKPTASSMLLTYPHILADQWLKIGATNSGAATLKWYRDVFIGSVPGASAEEDWIEQAVAAAPAGSEGLVFHPYLSGERTPRWQPNATGSFVGITARHDRAHFARAVLEGVAFSIRDCLDHIEQESGKVSSLKLIGGGARSRGMKQLLSDVIGRPLQLVPPHAAAVGSALVAAAAFGGVDDLASVAGLAAGTGPTLQPDPTVHDTYGAGFANYRNVADALLSEPGR